MVPSRICILGSTAAFVAACGSDGSSASAQGSPSRLALESTGPTATEYVRVPSGFARIDCLHEVPNGAHVSLDGAVTVDGADYARYAPCARSTASASPPGVNDAWIEWSEQVASPVSGLQYFNSLSSKLVVPLPPTTTAVAPTYLFSSLRSTNPASPVATQILQPVLQYGVGPNGQGEYWSLAVWHVLADGTAWFSTSILVSPGDVIDGSISLVASSSSGQEWLVTASDERTGQSVALQFSTTGDPFDLAEPAVFEAQPSACSDNPASPATFSNVVLTQAGPGPLDRNPVANAFIPTPPANPGPCGYSVTCTGDGTTLDYGPDLRQPPSCFVSAGCGSEASSVWCSGAFPELTLYGALDTTDPTKLAPVPDRTFASGSNDGGATYPGGAHAGLSGGATQSYRACTTGSSTRVCGPVVTVPIDPCPPPSKGGGGDCPHHICR